MTQQTLLRQIPSVDRLLCHPASVALLERFSRAFVTARCRGLLDELRKAIVEGRSVDVADLDEDALAALLERRVVAESRSGLRRVVNATGTMLHTNLGRAALAPEAVEALRLAAEQPVDLEYDLARGGRGRREDRIARLLMELTGAEAATVVNNNAAAVLIVLATLASGREVIVSRGELVEIGGSFRIPEIMAGSGALLREVGTTNRTHARDYESAIGERTALLMKVHTSNYRIVGFHSAVGLAELVAIGRARGVPVIEDLGSGALIDLEPHGLAREPVVAERIASGADVVSFSGDKLLGGPQAGLIVGRRSLIEAIAAHPLHRALRCSKLSLAALEATLKLYQQAPDVTQRIPTLRLFTRPLAELEAVGREAIERLCAALGPEYAITLEDSTSQVGSGALPTDELPTKAVVIVHPSLSADALSARFRAARPSIIGRIQRERFLLDLRTVFDARDLVPQRDAQ